MVVHALDCSTASSSLLAVDRHGVGWTVDVGDLNGTVLLDRASVYFMTGSAVGKVSRGGGTPSWLSAPPNGQTLIRALAIDDLYVYWVSQDTTARILRRAK
jgi:hypothetical protein